jgi:hypothetical protein
MPSLAVLVPRDFDGLIGIISVILHNIIYMYTFLKANYTSTLT